MLIRMATIFILLGFSELVSAELGYIIEISPLEKNDPLLTEVNAGLNEKAASGDAESQYLLGKYFEDYKDKTPDYSQAIYWHTKAIQKNHSGAIQSMSGLCSRGRGEKTDYEEIFNFYRELTKKGLLGAQVLLGQFYLYGCGVEKDIFEALILYTGAAVKNNSSAQGALGNIYSQNPAVYPRLEKYKKAAEFYFKNEPYLKFPKDFYADNMSIYWYLQASNNNNGGAQHNLANIFSDRGEIDKAIALYFKALQNADSIYHSATWDMLEQILSVGYNRMKSEDGNPVPEWWIEPAEKGDPEAQHISGIIFGRYPGLESHDYPKSIYWYTQAANQGYGPSQHALGFIYLEGSHVPRDDAKAIEWWRKAAEIGYGPSQHNLGLMYLVGVGVEKNPWEAYHWLRLAGGKHANFAEQVLCQKDWVKDPDYISSMRERRSRSRQR